MIRRFSVNFALFSIAMDALCICLALALATFLRPYLDFLPFAAHYPEYLPTPWMLYLVFTIEWVAISLLLSVYDGRRNMRPAEAFTNLTLSSLLASVALAGTLFLTYRMLSRLLFMIFVGVAYLFMLGWREVAKRIILRRVTDPDRMRKVLIVGAGQVGCEWFKTLEAVAMTDLQVVGFLDDDLEKRSVNQAIIGTLDEIQSVVQNKGIDEVVIALPRRANERISQVVGVLHRLPVRVWVIPDYYNLALYKANIEQLGGIPMLDLRAPVLNDYQRLVKRAFDIMIAALSLPFLLPLMCLSAVAIWIESRGPLLLHQERAGENGRLFKMYKFRTMVANAEELQHMVEHIDEQGHFVHKSPGDPRVTRVGRILRRFSLDEIPQVINVLKGEMSLVGPRPELPYLVEQYELWQRQRFAVPQGITGWWQIHGRSDKPMHLNTEDDLYYVQHYSLLLDIYILFKTVGVVLRGEGAF